MVAIGLVWAFNVFGVRPAVWFGYVTGAALMLPAAVLMFLPYVTGDWSSDNMNWLIGSGGGLALALTWLYFMGWSSYGFEAVASFAPEYEDPIVDTPRALRSSAAFSVLVYALLPLGIGGTLGTEAIAGGSHLHLLLHHRLRHPRRRFPRNRDGPLPDRRVAAVDEHRDDGRLASPLRHRQGRDDVKQLGVLNRFNVPGRAMTVDALLNLFLITYFAAALEIIAAGNLGYILAHVFALTGFMLLRRDRPDWPRPIKLSAIWVPIAGVLAAATCCSSSSAGSSTPEASSARRPSTATAGTRRGSACSSSRIPRPLRVPPRGPGQDGHPAARGSAADAGGRRAAGRDTGGALVGRNEPGGPTFPARLYSGLSSQRGSSAIASR